MLFFASFIFSTLTFSLLAPSANAQTVVATRRRSVGSIVAGCVVGGLFFLVILCMCCMMVSRRRTRSLGGPSIEDPRTPNSNSGTMGGGTRIVAVHSRLMFFGRRRGLFRGPRVIAMSSWSGAPTHQQQQQRIPSPSPLRDNPKAENTDCVTSSGATSPPPPYGRGQLEEDSLAKNQRVEKAETYAMSPTLNQPEQAHIKEEGSNFVGGFRP